jgi:hypothetical protein
VGETGEVERLRGLVTLDREEKTLSTIDIGDVEWWGGIQMVSARGGVEVLAAIVVLILESGAIVSIVSLELESGSIVLIVVAATIEGVVSILSINLIA